MLEGVGTGRFFDGIAFSLDLAYECCAPPLVVMIEIIDQL